MSEGERSKRVLVVEDDQDVNTLLCRYLAHRNYDCTGAHSAEQCLGALTGAPLPDVILIDLELPDMDGAELCGRIHQHMASSEIPVLLMSGVQMTEQSERLQGIGASALLLKPFSPRELLSKVEQMLASH